MTKYRFHGRTEQTKAAIKRKADGKALFAMGKQHYLGAMYLAGYAIECKLKAAAMLYYNVDTLKDLSEKMKIDEARLYSHNLEALMGLTPLDKSIRTGEVWKDFVTQVSRWSPSWRYDSKNPPEEIAAAFLAAVNNVYNWIDANS